MLCCSTGYIYNHDGVTQKHFNRIFEVAYSQTGADDLDQQLVEDQIKAGGGFRSVQFEIVDTGGCSRDM